MIEYGLKLSLRLLFGISNILSLGWGNSRTYLFEKEKNEKKNVDCHGSTQKNRKKKKNEEPKTSKILVS
jgi:hypothetical protein